MKPIDRAPYFWMFWLPSFLIGLGSLTGETIFVGLWLLFIPIFMFGAMRRCKAIGWSPWLVIGFFVPLVNVYVNLVLLFTRTTVNNSCQQ